MSGCHTAMMARSSATTTTVTAPPQSNGGAVAMSSTSAMKVQDFGFAVERTNGLLERYHGICSGTMILQKELERFYLKSESAIRERVLVLDEIQANISEERRCLEVQHQECRSQISATRKLHSLLQREQTKMSEILGRAVAVIDAEEKEVDEKIAEVDAQLAEIERQAAAGGRRKERVGSQEAELEKRERKMFLNEQDLEKALRELKNINDEVMERKRALEKKEGSISVWNRALESREADLSRCQEQFRADLRKVEEDEKRYGVFTVSSSVAPLMSQRQIMDNNNMTIDHETDCEEIDLGDGNDDDNHHHLHLFDHHQHR